jgi:hypothetical protein
MPARLGDGIGWWVGAALLALILAGCASGGAAGTGTRTRVPITELQSVVGRWDGLLSGLSSRPSSDEDLIDVVIRDDATYEARAFRAIGVFQGRGTVEVRDGALLLRSERGATGTAELFAVDGRRVLEVHATAGDGRRVTARLTPKR